MGAPDPGRNFRRLLGDFASSPCVTLRSVYQLDWIDRLRARHVSMPGWQQLRNVHSTVWFLGWTSLLTDVSSEAVNSILPVYVLGTLRLSPMEFGLIDGIYQGAGAALAAAFAGLMADRWRRHKEVAATGYGISALCKLALLAAGNGWGLLAAIIGLDRLAKGARTPSRDALISLASSDGQLGLSFGVHRAMDACGALIGPMLASFLLLALPQAFDTLFLVSFSIGVIGWAVLAILVPSAIVVSRPLPSLRITLGALRQAFADWRIRRLLMAAGLLSVSTMSDGFIFISLQRKTGLSPGYFPLLYVFSSLVLLVLAVPAGLLADAVGRHRVLLLGYLLMGLNYLLLGSPATGWWVIGGSLALLGSYYAATDGVLAALASGLLPAEWRASGLALIQTVVGLGKLAASLMAGFLMDRGNVASMAAVFLTMAAVCTSSAVILLGRQNTHGHRA